VVAESQFSVLAIRKVRRDRTAIACTNCASWIVEKSGIKAVGRESKVSKKDFVVARLE
jgi:hypothetical protein